MPLSLIFSILRQPKISRVRTPTLLQMEATECGAASRGIILSNYGASVGFREMVAMR
jgi:hypothetical protein